MKPTDLFPNMTSDGSAITIPRGDLLQEDVSTGQALALNLISTIWKRWRNYSPSPTRARVTRNNPQGIGVDRIRLNHTFSFDVEYTSTTAQTVAEPPTIAPPNGDTGGNGDDLPPDGGSETPPSGSNPDPEPPETSGQLSGDQLNNVNQLTNG